MLNSIRFQASLKDTFQFVAIFLTWILTDSNLYNNF